MNDSGPTPDNVEADAPQIIWSCLLGRSAVDNMCQAFGVIPNEEIRFTIAQILTKAVPDWLEQSIRDIAAKIQISN